MKNETHFPSKDEVYEKVDQAIAQLLERDSVLLQIDANERTISHRLGLYLQMFFDDWHVDCEYNRNLDNPKRLKTYDGLLNGEQRGGSVSDVNAITVFPDILVHKRMTSTNLLVIEMKKTTSQISDDFDYFKLREFKYQYGYPHALFLKFITGDTEQAGLAVKEYLPDPI